MFHERYDGIGGQSSPAHCLAGNPLVQNGFYDWGLDHSVAEKNVNGGIESASAGCLEFDADSDGRAGSDSYTATTWEGWDFGRALPCPQGAATSLHCRAIVLEKLRTARNATQASTIASECTCQDLAAAPAAAGAPPPVAMEGPQEAIELAARLGPRCLQAMGMHAMDGDTLEALARRATETFFVKRASGANATLAASIGVSTGGTGGPRRVPSAGSGAELVCSPADYDTVRGDAAAVATRSPGGVVSH